MSVSGFWSRSYDVCTVCGKTEFPYKAKGMCKHCYNRAEETRSRARGYRAKHPEVFTKRTEQIHFRHRFGDEKKREEVIKLYGERCVDCGISREEKIQKSGHDLNVMHTDLNLNNNEIENLRPICRSCQAARIHKLRDKNITLQKQRLQNRPGKK